MLRRVRVEATADQVRLLAAGVAFFLLLSLVPTLIAAVSVHGLVSVGVVEGVIIGAAMMLAGAPSRCRWRC